MPDCARKPSSERMLLRECSIWLLMVAVDLDRYLDRCIDGVWLYDQLVEALLLLTTMDQGHGQ